MIDYNDIIKKYGTPSYVYHIDTLLERINYLKNKLSNQYEIVYAVKANTFIVKELEDVVSRYEICSPGEFEICNKLHINHNKMVISGVYKDDETINMMLDKYPNILKYTIESVNQYKLLESLAKKYNRQIHALIRITSGNQFGISKEEAIELIKNKSGLIEIDGIEYFSGTQKHNLKIIEKEIISLKEFIEMVKRDLNFDIKELEYGPGAPVFYYQDDEFCEEEFLDGLKNILDKIKGVKITLELGRSIAASCGFYLTSVVDMKTNKYGNFVILDGGINHLVYYGQTMAMKIPYYDLIPHKESKELITYNLCGSLCTINDFLVKNIETRKLEKNDVFVFKNVGAYSSTEGISLFLSRDLPKIILVKNNVAMLVRDTIKTSEINFPNI